jgi:hypothetical protein
MTAAQADVRVALCFYGIPRALPATAPLIQKHVAAPLENWLRGRGQLLRFAHFFESSAEAGEDVNHDSRSLLGLDELHRDPPGDCLEQWGFKSLLSAGDFWDNDGISLRNLIHQLHSLKQVTALAMHHDITHCVFLRPDLLYHDSFAPHLDHIFAAQGPLALIPGWQHWKGGMNDRFAVCIGSQAIRAWGMRVDLMSQYCQMTHSPLHSERLVAFALWAHGIRDQKLPVRASRLRANGVQVQEDFAPHPIKRFRQRRRLEGLWRKQGIVQGFASQD